MMNRCFIFEIAKPIQIKPFRFNSKLMFRIGWLWFSIAIFKMPFIEKLFGKDYKLEKAFRIKHFNGDSRYAHAETDKGYLHINPLYIGINNSPAYILYKPQWQRIGGK